MTAPPHDDLTRTSFRRQVGLFSGPTSPFALRARSTRTWLEPLDDTMVVLDVACGAGHAADQVAPHVRQVVGIDLTPELLALGARRMEDAGLTNVLFQEGDAASLPFVDASFDLVYCRTAVHHFTDPEIVVAEMARVTRPGGRVAVADLVVLDADARGTYDALHRRIDPSHVRVLLEAELADLVERGVGPLADAQTGDPLVLPVDLILTEQSDDEAVLTALQAELAGGPATGFAPSLDDEGRVLVSFTNTVVQAIRP
ncbi:MAG TPA: methyltransferase domain-containing protein [Acidimicrobiia bacterium]|jgi:SAM-dependent methyltransferase